MLISLKDYKAAKQAAKNVYETKVSEIRVTPTNEETIKLLEDDKTEFNECYNESNILAG